MKTQGRTLDYPCKLPATTFCCRVAFKCQAYEGQTVSGHAHILRIQVWQKRHLAVQGRVSLRDPAVPMRGVRCCSCSRVAFPSRDPGTPCVKGFRGCKEQRSGCTTQVRQAPPARATNPRTGGRLSQRPAGTNPRTGEAADSFFNTVGTHVSILDFGGYVSEVVRGSGTRVGALVG